MPDDAGPSPWVEGASRWLARRSTRRSFLGRVGHTAVLVAGGSSLATLLVGDEAEARVCGQSGVSGKCATYDCDDGVWGWCWYATGCCSGGELKKICDCCAPVDNVHGYCPSGTNVLCIVESCGTDPRVQVVALRRVPTNDAVLLSVGASRAVRAEASAAEVWLVDVQQWLLASVLAPAAARRGIPLLLVAGAGAGLGTQLIAELQRLGTRKVVLHGPGLGAGVVGGATRYGLTVERATDVDGTVGSIAGVAERLAADAAAAGVRRVVAIEPTGRSFEAAPLAAAFAASKGYPLVIGADVAQRLRPTLAYLVGPEAAARAGEVQGGHPVFPGEWSALSAELVRLALTVEQGAVPRVALLPQALVGAQSAVAGLLAAGGPVLVHTDGTLDGARDVLFAVRDRLRDVVLGGATGALSTDAYYELQSVVNGFDAHKLVGVSGQGLPVIDQPLSERPLGLARRSNTPPVEAGPQYWTGRGLDLSDS